MIIRYTIDYYDEVDEVRKTERGISWGKNMGAAVNRVVNWYGKDNVFSISVHELEEVLYDDDLIAITGE